MSSTKHNQNGTSGENSSQGSLHIPGLIKQLSPADQLPFPVSDYTSPPVESLPSWASQIQSPSPFSPHGTRPLSTSAIASDETRALMYMSSPNVTRQLSSVETGILPVPAPTRTTALRQSVVIPATGKKSTGTMRPPKGRRWVVQIAVTAIIVVILFVSLLSVLPIGPGGAHAFNLFQPIVNLVRSNGSNVSFVAQQAATATAITQDGHEVANLQNSPFLPTAPPGTSNGNSFTYGQCTYWADSRYHALTGHWVPWGGNADEWSYGAAHSAGWVVSSQPHIPSIIVLQPGVQQAGWYGHVAVVEEYNKDGTLNTSNWNWDGNWGYTTYVTFKPGPGVSFVWYVG